MPTFSDSILVGAGATIINVLAGSKFEFVGQLPSQVNLYAVASEFVLGVPQIFHDLTLGTVVIADPSAVAGEPDAVAGAGSSGQGPFRDRHLFTGGQGSAGDRVQIRVTNNDAVNAARYRLIVDFNPILL